MPTLLAYAAWEDAKPSGEPSDKPSFNTSISSQGAAYFDEAAEEEGNADALSPLLPKQPATGPEASRTFIERIPLGGAGGGKDSEAAADRGTTLAPLRTAGRRSGTRFGSGVHVPPPQILSWQLCESV
ncbi:hypothetical protein GGTG_13324 [Gaeumannomyces tritici R3-111a-1]|uniref:Uncharacterized protein n=1 Tax=Gaeumannomyces tritici (strain R3-111a-1) TaxID=644352 RepID=J3PIJ5_GAET3|nr:hypothetical protein GGTG_13324 [Gaeumannomyces tritici R3-111a-1]EJT69056.1 hypothetical protein GGTG_13324 [Gaeumannomyces tritici R3-111a-1]